MLIIKTFIGETVIKLLGLIKFIFINPFLIRYLGVSDYGLYMYIIATAGMLSLVFNLGTLDYTTTYYNNATKSEQKQHIGSLYFVNITMFLILTAFILSYVNYYDVDFFGIDKKYILLLAIIGLVPLFTHAFQIIAQYQRKLRKIYTLSILSMLMFISVLAYSIYFEKSLYELILYYVYSQVIYLIICIIYLKEISFNFNIKFSSVKKILPVSIFFTFNSVVFFALTYTDRVLIIHYMSEYDLGLYSLSASIIMIVTTVLSSVLFPVVKTKINENIKNSKALSEIGFLSDATINIIGIPVIMGLGVYGYNFLIFYAGDGFEDSYKYMVVLLLVIYTTLISYFYMEKYLLQHKKNAISKLFKINVLVLIINLSLNIITIPKYGLYGAAISSLIAYSIQFILLLYFTNSLNYFTYILRYILPTAFVWGIGYNLWDDNYGFWWMWVYCIISMFVYWFLIYLMYNKDIKKLYFIARKVNEN